MGKIKYMAQWYEADAFDESGFVPDNLHSSYHDTMDEAKQTAFKNASRHDAVGWAGVWLLHPPLSDNDDEIFVNEIYKNKWSGWVKR